MERISVKDGAIHFTSMASDSAFLLWYRKGRIMNPGIRSKESDARAEIDNSRASQGLLVVRGTVEFFPVIVIQHNTAGFAIAGATFFGLGEIAALRAGS